MKWNKFCTMLLVFLCAVNVQAQTKNAKGKNTLKKHPEKQSKAKNTLQQSKGFNVAEFSEQRTLITEKHFLRGTDSVIVENYYVWLIPD